MAELLPVSKPRQSLPVGAWDCHAHIFGPWDEFPLAESPPYQPPLASRQQYLSMLEGVGFDHGVVVHGSAYGWDNSATVKAASALPEKLTGVCVVPSNTGDEELENLHISGIRGVRVTQALPQAAGAPGTLGMDDIAPIAERVRDFGWHINIWAQQSLLREYWESLANMGVPVIFDHMGFAEVDKGVTSSGFRWFLDAIKDTGFYVKLGPGRVSKDFPAFDNVRPFFDAFLEAVPDQLVFSSDWPYLGLDMTEWDPGNIVDLFDSWINDVSIRQKIYVDNSRRFYLRR